MPKYLIERRAPAPAHRQREHAKSQLRGIMGKRLPLIALAAAFLAAGCDEEPTSPEEDGLETLRQVTNRYHDVAAAVQDGFQQALPCQENPDGPGALGIPYLNADRLDTTIDLENPEVLFYEPQQNGDLELVGLEPVVPIDAWDAEYDEPPTVLGQSTHRQDAEGLYGLHIWIWRDNPDGVFAFWHPDVSCQYATE